MAEVRLVAETRTEFGKGHARRTRKAGKIPAVLYGHGTAPRHLSIDSRSFAHAIKGGANTVLTLHVDGEDVLTLPKAVVRHPLRDYVEHLDLLLVRRGEKVTVDVQIVLVGEAVPNTLVLTDANVLTIEVDALAIPGSLEVSIAGLRPGAQILAGAVILPAGATLAGDADELIVSIQQEPTAAQVEAELESAEADMGIEHDAPTPHE